MDRRAFIQNLTLSLILSKLSHSTWATTSKNELIIQLQHFPSKKYSLLFFDLMSRRVSLLSLPYYTHGILPIRENSEFIVTTKGGYLFHTTRNKILASIKSPEHHAFFGHSSFDPKLGKIYTSGVRIQNYDHSPVRKPEPMAPNDKTFCRGRIFEIDLEPLKITDSFDSGGFLTHDQRLLPDSKLLVLNSGEKIHDLRGHVTTLDLTTKTVVSDIPCLDQNKECPVAHMYGPNERLAIVGISETSGIISIKDKHLQYFSPDPKLSEYTFGEMLNVAFSPKGDTVCSMNVDNGFVGLWDYKSGKLLKSFYLPHTLSVNEFQNQFVVSHYSGFFFYDLDLNLQHKVTLEELGLKDFIISGPHSLII